MICGNLLKISLSVTKLSTHTIANIRTEDWDHNIIWPFAHITKWANILHNPSVDVEVWVQTSHSIVWPLMIDLDSWTTDLVLRATRRLNNANKCGNLFRDLFMKQKSLSVQVNSIVRQCHLELWSTVFDLERDALSHQGEQMYKCIFYNFSMDVEVMARTRNSCIWHWKSHLDFDILATGMCLARETLSH